MNLLGYSTGHIDIHVSSSSFSTFCFTGFHGNPRADLRKFSWELLRHLSNLSHFPWLVAIDFNEILSIDEKTRCIRSNWQIYNFETP